MNFIHMFSISDKNRANSQHDPELYRTLRILASLHGNYDNGRANQQNWPVDRSQYLRISQTFQKLAQSTKNPNSSVVPKEPICSNSNLIVNFYNKILQLGKEFDNLLATNPKKIHFNCIGLLIEYSKKKEVFNGMILTALETNQINELISEMDAMLKALHESHEPIDEKNDEEKKDNLCQLMFDLQTHQKNWRRNPNKFEADFTMERNKLNKKLQRLTTHSRRDAKFNPDDCKRSNVQPGNKIRETLCESVEIAMRKLESIHKDIHTINPDKRADEIQSLFTIYFLSVDTIKKKYGIKPVDGFYTFRILKNLFKKLISLEKSKSDNEWDDGRLNELKDSLFFVEDKLMDYTPPICSVRNRLMLFIILLIIFSLVYFHNHKK